MKQKLVFRYIRRLLKHNYSLFVNLPKSTLDLMDWKKDDPLRVDVDINNKIIKIYKLNMKGLKGGNENAL